MSLLSVRPGAVILRPLPQAGLRGMRRGEVLLIGTGAQCDAAIGETVVYNANFSERFSDGDEEYILLTNPRVAIACVDERTMDERAAQETHSCLYGMTQPGPKETCVVEQRALAMAPFIYQAEYAKLGNQKAFPKTLLNDIADGTVTPEEARDRYNIPIEEDILRKES